MRDSGFGHEREVSQSGCQVSPSDPTKQKCRGTCATYMLYFVKSYCFELKLQQQHMPDNTAFLITAVVPWLASR